MTEHAALGALARLLGGRADRAADPVGGLTATRQSASGLVALPLGDTFVTQRNMIDPQVKAIQAGAEMARVGLVSFSDGRDFIILGGAR